MIRQETLFELIRHKASSSNRWLTGFEFVMIGANLLAAGRIIWSTIQDGGPGYKIAISVVYLLFFAYAVLRRRLRRKEEVRFPQTIVGELDKAVWQIDYLISESRSLTLGYTVPLMLIFFVLMFFEPRIFWAWLLMLVVIPASLVEMRWENNKVHLPRKQEL